MKILLIGNHFSDSRNNPNAWQELALKLRAAGHAVITASGRKGKLPRLLEMLTAILFRQDQYQVAGVDVFSGKAFLFASLSGSLLKAVGKPFVLTLHGGNLPAFAKAHGQRVRSLLSKADAVVAPSGYLQSALAPYHDGIRLIPNALEIRNYPYRHRTHPRPRLVWLRAFHEIYNPGLALKALAMLKEEFPDLHLVMVGPDKGDGSLQAARTLSADLALESSVTFSAGIPKSAVPEFLNSGDIFLNSTNVDNTPISVMEAMACGLCVVSTKVGGIPWLARDGEEALLVAPGDATAMAAAVRRALTEPGLAGRLSANARAKAESIDWSVILPRWESQFSELIDQQYVRAE